jgi:hypothetical protein
VPETWGGILLNIERGGGTLDGHLGGDGWGYSNGNGLTSAATVRRTGVDRLVPYVATWQEEVWRYYESLGEFAYGIEWLTNMVSRCRLTAARTLPGGDEPEVLDTGPAAELVEELGGDLSGQAEIISDLAFYLSVPGEGYLIGETVGGGNDWYVRSAHEIRRAVARSPGREATVQIATDDSTPDNVRWRLLPTDSLVVRVWRPHKKYHFLPDSPANHARTTMAECELVNRRIIAEYLSRLASAGLVIFPNEVQFPTDPKYQDEDDPFIAAWIGTAAEAIEHPGTPSAVVPLPIRVPGEYIDKIRHIDFTTKFDDRLLEKRESALRRLATTLDLPAEIVLGMGSVNHWTAWQLEESAIKVHISPVLELICGALTKGYLRPRLLAAGEDITNLVVWYDTSNLSVRPDRGQNALEAFDRFVVGPTAVRRELGLSEGDKPSDDDLVGMLLAKGATMAPELFVAVLKELFGIDLMLAPEVESRRTGPRDRPPSEVDSPTAPDTEDVPPPAPEEAAKV